MSRLDARAWFAWGAAAMLPLLTGRHPLVLLELLVIALTVRTVCVSPSRAMSWSWLARLSALAVPIGVFFNLVTVHAGDRVIVTIPDRVPVFGGDLTWNAAVYGALSGLTVVALVLVGTTIAAGIAWSEVMRMLPARAASLAVAGSIAWAFLPRLATSWQEIREAQIARGHRWGGPRDAVPLVAPLLAGGLERSILMAEALEARGFGAAATRPVGRAGSLAVASAIVAATTALYLFAIGRAGPALLTALVAACALGVVAVKGRAAGSAVTTYRTRRWTGPDSITVAGALVAAGATIVTMQVNPAALRWDPYPTLTLPTASVWLHLGIAALLLPAGVAPITSEEAS